jgi:hypothetical protein
MVMVEVNDHQGRPLKIRNEVQFFRTAIHNFPIVDLSLVEGEPFGTSCYIS